MGDLTKAQAEELLREAGLGAHQPIPDGTWGMLASNYVPHFRANPHALGEFIYHPRKVGDFTDD